jgi:acetylornithine deacetylase
VEELNASKFKGLDTRGPCSKYELPKENLVGKLSIEWAHIKSGEELMQGVACDLASPGFLAVCDAIKIVRGKVAPYSICGSLPLVKQMQDAGFDLCITGFGLSSSYHAENERCLLSDMLKACKILSLYTSKMEAHNKSKNNRA